MISDEREVPAQLDDAGQLAALLPGAADRGGGLLIDDEHARSLGRPGACGKTGRGHVLRVPVAAEAGERVGPMTAKACEMASARSRVLTGGRVAG